MLLRNRKILFSVHEKNIFVKQIRRTGNVVRNNLGRGKGWNAAYTAFHPLTGKPVRVHRQIHRQKKKLVVVFWGELFCS